MAPYRGLLVSLPPVALPAPAAPELVMHPRSTRIVYHVRPALSSPMTDSHTSGPQIAPVKLGSAIPNFTGALETHGSRSSTLPFRANVMEIALTLLMQKTRFSSCFPSLRLVRMSIGTWCLNDSVDGSKMA